MQKMTNGDAVPYRYFVVAPQALSVPLAGELQRLGAGHLQPLTGGIRVEGPLALGYRLCLWSRLASRVLLELAELPARDGDTLYQACREFPWEQHLGADTTFAIRFTGESAAFRHSHYGALRIKDALCDRLREQFGRRPDVDREQPQIRISAFLRRNRVTLYLELSGEPLHRRGYRLAAGAAPLKETLASGILALAGWGPQDTPAPLVDPLCGSGTLLLEGVMMALDLPTGLWRTQFGFEHWPGHDAALWQQLRREASEYRDRKLSAPQLLAWGSDSDAAAVQRARANAERLGMTGFFRFTQQSVTAVTALPGGPGLLVTNPPYGERLGDLAGVSGTYRELGEVLRGQFAGWRFAMITSNADLARETGLQPEACLPVRNGALDCEIWALTVPAASEPLLPVLDEARLTEWRQAFANRLAKNRRKLKGWLKQSSTDAFRLYDADIPEFAVAVDYYRGWWHVAEYASPAQVNSVHAAWRLKLVLEVLCQQEGATPDRIVLKTRERQRGSSQYDRQDARRERLIVHEGPARYIVNLTDYLDTGLFLDHRPLRRLVHAMAAGKRVLNLFCYTGSVTVQAALGGAASSLSIDLSNTYLDWARDNFQLNGLDPGRHCLQQADCLQWLHDSSDAFDLIVLDPPSFSNSKRMDATLDVQRDHAVLVDACLRCLAPGGVLLFSTNRRKFRLDEALLQRYRVEEITRETLDPDFGRDPPIHRCWRITHAGA